MFCYFSHARSPFWNRYEKAKVDLAAALKTLNDYLLTKTYLVGDKVTLADIVVASALLYPMKLVCDKAYLKPFGNVVRWFTTCVNQPQFKRLSVPWQCVRRKH